MDPSAARAVTAPTLRAVAGGGAASSGPVSERKRRAEEKGLSKGSETKRLSKGSASKRPSKGSASKRPSKGSESKRLSKGTETKGISGKAESKRLSKGPETKGISGESETKRLSKGPETKGISGESETKRLSKGPETKGPSGESETKRLSKGPETKGISGKAETKRLSEGPETKGPSGESETKRLSKGPETKGISGESETKGPSGESETKGVMEGSEPEPPRQESQFMSRLGLSVYAAPFVPRAVWESGLGELTPGSLSDPPALHDTPQYAIQFQPRLRMTSSSSSNTTAFQRPDIQSSVLEFPRTPLAEDGRCARRSPPLSTSAVAMPGSASCSAESVLPQPQRLTPLLASAVLTSPVMAQSAAAVMGLQSRSRMIASTSCISSLQCPTEVTDGTDNVRHRRVPFTDAEAMDVDTMLDLLHASTSDDEEEEGATLLLQQQQQNMADTGAGSLSNCDLYMCGRGYWDLEGPRAATRRYTRRVNSMGLTSPTMETVHGRDNNHNTSYALLDSTEVGECDEELWEMNSSAYADSLDEAQAEWIEEQLQAKENPEGFFF